MQITFLDAAGVVLFVRDDIETGEWTQEEYSVNATFPLVKGKEIQRGQRITFADPATGNTEFFEIRNVQTMEPEHYQQFRAESVALAELSDDHINEIEFYNVPPQTALAQVLTGTLWAVGNVSVGNTSQQATIRAQITALGLNGNVDLTSRPIVYPEAMQNAGYSDFSGDYATLYSSTYTETIGTNTAVTLLMTPIQQDGVVLSADALDAYVANLCKTSSTLAQVKANDTSGLLMHSLSGTQISEMDATAESAHTLSDSWETCVADVASSGKVSRGNVWQAVGVIADNWNVYIVPRITTNSAGSVTGRYLDIIAAGGTWRGLRLSIDKNMPDVSVTYDDSETVTALYGYGGNMDIADPQGDKTEECTFKDVVWTATADHPAKPAGQTYIEDTAKTALYGRNGRARFGYYQNGDITDPEVLLQKTWEALKANSEPKISISGTVVDLYRLGYADQPLRLHDTALVEIRQTGELVQKEIIRLTVDLVDPSQNRPEIGDYIPNIIYYNKEAEKDATGGGGGGGRGSTNDETEKSKYYTEWQSTDTRIAMVVGKRNGEYHIEAGQIALSINEQDETTKILLQADVIDIQGVVDSLQAYDVMVANFNAANGEFTGDLRVLGDTTLYGDLKGNKGDFVSLYVEDGGGSAQRATWQSATVVTDVGVTLPSVNRSSSRYFLYAASSGSTTPTGTQSGRVIQSYTDGSVSPTTKTIYYLGKAPT